MVVVLSLLSAAALASVPAPAAPDVVDVALPSVELPPDLARVLRDYEKAWAARDPAALAALFSEDGFVLQGGKAPVRGRAAIAAAYQGHGGPLALRALDFAVDGAVGFIIGAYSAAVGEPDAGKFTLTLRRSESGHWLIHSDMDNGNAPLRPPVRPAGG